MSRPPPAGASGARRDIAAPRGAGPPLPASGLEIHLETDLAMCSWFQVTCRNLDTPNTPAHRPRATKQSHLARRRIAKSRIIDETRQQGNAFTGRERAF